MNTAAIFVGDVVEENGKTVKENNLEKKHIFPIGSLVELLGPEESKGLRLFVMGHTRDVDGTPLYSLTGDPDYIGFTTGPKKDLSKSDKLDVYLQGRSIGIDDGKKCGEWSGESLVIIRYPGDAKIMTSELGTFAVFENEQTAQENEKYFSGHLGYGCFNGYMK